MKTYSAKSYVSVTLEFDNEKGRHYIRASYPDDCEAESYHIDCVDAFGLKGMGFALAERKEKDALKKYKTAIKEFIEVRAKNIDGQMRLAEMSVKKKAKNKPVLTSLEYSPRELELKDHFEAAHVYHEISEQYLKILDAEAELDRLGKSKKASSHKNASAKVKRLETELAVLEKNYAGFENVCGQYKTELVFMKESV